MKVGDKPWYAIAMGRKALLCCFLAGMAAGLAAADHVAMYLDWLYADLVLIPLAVILLGATKIFAAASKRALVTCVMELWDGWKPGFDF